MPNTKPFLRWAGGKRWLASSLSLHLSDRLGKAGIYFEPFLGSGAVFFALSPFRAILSDLNRELIITFQQVKKRPDGIIRMLSKMRASRHEYYRVRSWLPNDHLDRAVRFIYLNRNGWGGLYRENLRGLFNVPYGGGERSHKIVCYNGIIPRAAQTLRESKAKLLVRDFKHSLVCASRGDVVFCDPTYRGVSRGQFDRYGNTIFSWEDQIRLARLAREAFKRGALIVICNVASADVLKLYPSAIIVELVRPKGLGPLSNITRQMEHLYFLDPLHEVSRWRTLGKLEKK